MPGATRRAKPLKGTTGLAELSDFSISGASNGDLLVYNSGTEKWENTKTLTGDYSVQGLLTATDIQVNDDLTVTDDLAVGGLVTIGETLSVTGATTLAGLSATTGAFSGAVTMDSTLSVAGTLSGSDLSLSGDATITGDITANDITGSGTVLGNFLESTLDTTVGRNLIVNDDAFFAQDVTVAGTLYADNLTATDASFPGDLTIGGDFYYEGGLGYLVHDGTDTVVGNSEGLVELEHSGVPVLRTNRSGIFIYGHSDFLDWPFIEFYAEDTTTRHAIISARDSGEGFLIEQETHGELFTFIAEDSGGTNRNVFTADGDGAVDLYFAGSVSFRTTALGADIFDTSGDNALLGWYEDNGSTRSGYIRAIDNVGMVFYSDINSRQIFLQGDDSGGTFANLVIGDPDGAVELYYDASLAVRTTTVGADVVSATDDNPLLGFYEDDGSTRQGYIRGLNNAGMVVYSDVNSSFVYLQGDDSGGAFANLVNGDPDAEVNLYFDNALVFRTIANGARLRDPVGTSTDLEFYDGSTKRGEIFWGDSIVRIDNDQHGAAFDLLFEDAGGANQTPIDADPDGPVILEYDGATAFETTAEGIAVQDTSGDLPLIEWYQDNGSTRNAYMRGHNTLGVIIYSDINSNPFYLQGDDSGGAFSTMFQGDPDGEVLLFYDGAEKFNTNSLGISVNATAAIITSGAGSPESAVTAPVGSIYLRTDGGTSTTLYVKESGAGNTGWVAK